MISNILTRIFGSRNERLLKQYGSRSGRSTRSSPRCAALPDDALRAKTAELKSRVADGETLDDVLPEAFAVVREAGKRALGMRHFDVQLIGGMALHHGKIAEMRTGEGKTLVATLPAYLNALAGKGVHIVTVNDYLAQRDADWMGRIYRFLGLTVGVNLSQMAHDAEAGGLRGRHHLRHQQRVRLRLPARQHGLSAPGERVQRPLTYAIVDEVDSILIDEARTPLIISGQADDNIELYYRLNEIVPKLTRQAEEKGAGRLLGRREGAPGRCSPRRGTSSRGHARRRRACSPRARASTTPPTSSSMHHLYAALRAHALFHRDQHYVVQNGEVIIVDEFTGRLMPGRRWSDGLHQAVEAKEGVPIQRENQTLASITFQNYFRMYQKLAGMTGTADTEAYEFQQIYGLETVVIPTNQPMVRSDENDQVYRTFQEKVDAIITDIRDCHERGQPVLVGTTSIENSELLSQDPRQGEAAAPGAEREAARARGRDRRAGRARRGMITIATNMAGRGTDIVLGGTIEPQCWPVRDDESLAAAEKERAIAAMRSEWQARHDAVIRPAACTSSAPSATSRGASTTSCAAAPAARATRAARASTSRSRIRCCASSAASGSARSCSGSRCPRASRSSIRSSTAPSRRRRRGRGAQLRHPQAAARVRRRRQRPAQGDLPAAQRAAGSRPTSRTRSTA